MLWISGSRLGLDPESGIDPYADPKNSLLPSKLYTFFNYQMNSFIFNATL
eukprot:COSAG01_NODE_73677_length_239_cov_4.685714_1_plen_49_part_01